MCKRSVANRFFCILLGILLLLSFVGCSQTTEAGQTEPAVSYQPHPHQELTAMEAAVTMDTSAQQISIPQIGLENVLVCDATSDKVALQENAYGQVYLLGDDRYGGFGLYAMDHYLVIQLDDRLIAEDLLAYDDHVNLEGSVDARDFDGDGDCEILVQQRVGMTGGCGAYLTRIFDVKDGQLLLMYSFEDILDRPEDQQGFTATLLENGQYQIAHKESGYCESFSLHSEAAAYYADDRAGERIALEIDSFYEVEADDVDGDGIWELCCTQYSWYRAHNDGLGDVKTVWKYDPQTEKFAIIRVSFVAYTE